MLLGLEGQALSWLTQDVREEGWVTTQATGTEGDSPKHTGSYGHPHFKEQGEKEHVH